MAKLLSISTDALTSSSGSSYINKSGIYDVVIKFASVEQSKSGATQVNFNVDYNGNTQAIYGPYIASKDGTPISMGVRFLTELGIISGLKEGEDLTTEEESFKVGKDNKEKEFTIITQFSDLEVKMRLQEEYSSYNGEISKRMVLKAVYRGKDGASAEEISNNSEVGVKLKKDQAYASDITYTDCTADEVEEGKKSKAEAAKSPKAEPKAAVKATGSVFKKQ